MPELFQDNLHSTLIPTKVASEISGYNSDYLGRLCREKKIQATQVGRSWLVNRASLEAFVKEQEDRKLVRSEELRAAREKEYRSAQKPALKNVVARASATASGATQAVFGQMARSRTRAQRLAASTARTTRALRPASRFSLETRSPRLAALAVALAVVAGSAFASTDPHALSFLNAAPDAAVRFAFNSQVLLDGPSSFRVTDQSAGETNLAAALPPVPDSNDTSRSFALLSSSSSMTALAFVHALTDDARVPLAQTELVDLAHARIASLSEAARDPLGTLVRAYVGVGESFVAANANIENAYLSGVMHAGDATLAAAAMTRDGIAFAPKASNAILNSYVSGIYAWNDAAPKAAGTVVLALYNAGDIVSARTAAVPAIALETQTAIVESAANSVHSVNHPTASNLALSESTQPHTQPQPAAVAAAAAVPPASAIAPNRVPNTQRAALALDTVTQPINRLYASAVSAAGAVLSLPIKAENTMLGVAGYTSALLDGTELPSSTSANSAQLAQGTPQDSFYANTTQSANALSFLPPSWHLSFAKFFHTTSMLARALFSSGFHSFATLFPGGNVMAPTLTVLNVGPTETLSLPIPADVTRNSTVTYSGGDRTVVQNVFNNYYPQALIGSVFNDAVLAIVRPFVNASIAASLRVNRGGSGGGSSGGTSGGISSDGATLTNVTISSGTATLSTLDSSNSSLGDADATTLAVSGSTTLASLLVTGNTDLSTTTVTGDLNVSGTLTVGSFAVGNLSSYSGIVAPFFTATDTAATSTFTNLTATNITTTAGLTAANITSTGTTSVASLTIGSLSGFLKATAGVIGTALIDLSTDVTSTLPTANGGTGSTSLTGILKGNGTGPVLTAVDGTDYISAATYGGSFYAYFHATTTDALAEGSTNKYYTDARARAAISSSATGLSYDNTTGVFSLTSGYNIPLTASTTEWNSFYTTPSSRITAGTNLSWAGNTLNGVSDAYIRNLFSATSPLSYNSGTGVFSFATSSFSGSGSNLDADFLDGLDSPYFLANSFSTTSANYWLTTKTTDNLAQGTTNRYYSDTLARAALSSSALGLTYDNTTGVFSLTSGYTIPLTASTTEWNTAYMNRITSATAPLSITNNVLSISQASATTDGYLSSIDWNSFNGRLSTTTLGLFDKGYFFSTTSASYFLAQNQDSAFSTTSANYWLTTKSTSDLAEGSNLYYTSGRATANFVSNLAATTSVNSITTLANLSLPLSQTTGVLAQNNGGTGISSYNPGDILYADNSGNLATLAVGSTGQVLKVQAGLPSWGVDQTVGAGGAGDGIFATSTNLIYPIDTASTVVIGNNATSTNNSIFEVIGQQYISTKLGIASTSPSQALSVVGNGIISGNFWAGGTGTFGNIIDSGLTADTLTYANGSKQLASVTVTGPLAFSGGTLSITQASGSTNGYLSSADWTTFNNKQAALTFTYPLVNTANVISLAFGTTTANSWSQLQTFNGGLIANNATTTSFGINGETFTDLTGSGLLNIGGALTLDRSGDWTGTFDGQEGSYYLNRANHTGTQTASTISDFNTAVNSYIAASTTIPKTYTANTFTSLQTFNSGITTNALTIGTLNGPLQANNGVVSATTSIGVLYGGTGLTVAPTYGQVLVGNSSGGYTLTATSSLGLLSSAITSIGPAGQQQTGPAITLASSTTGTDFTITAAGNTITFNLPTASASNRGLLSATDWTTFNNKENVLTFTYPLVRTGNVISTAFGTTTSNTFAGTQTFTNSPVFSTLGAGTVNSTSGGTLYATGTSTPTLSSELSYSGTLGQFIGGSSGALSVTTNGLALSKLVQAGANTILGNPTGVTGNVQAFATSSLGVALSDTTGTLTVPRGGTGQVSFTAGNLIYGAGTGALQNVATSSIAVSGPLSYSGTFGALVGGTGGTLTIANAAADGTTKGAATFTAADFNDNGAGLISIDYTNGQKATASVPGFLSAADFTTFNSKQAALTFTYPLVNTANVVSLAFGTTTANSWSQLQTFNGGITVTGNTSLAAATSTSLFSNVVLANTAAFGQTGSTTIASNGALTTPALTIGSLNGLLKATSGVVSAAASGTDYAPATTGTSLLYGNGAGGFSNASVSSPLTFSGGLLGIQVANGSQPGYLTSADFNTFNGKENVLTFTYPLTRSSNTISLAFGTTTSNTWAGTQTFTNAPIFSSLNGILKGNGASAVTAVTGTDNFLPKWSSNSLTSTSLVYDNALEVRIGTTTNYAGNSSRLFVWGGATGANVDIMGDPSIGGGDQATVEVESSSYPSTFKSAYLQYVNHGVGTNLGFANTELAQLVLGGDTNLIYTNSSNPLIFGTNSTERMRLSATGNLSIATTTTSDYLLTLDANTTNDNSRALSLTQSNDSAEDTYGIYLSNIANPGTLIVGTLASKNIWGIDTLVTPTYILANTAGNTVATTYGADSTVNLNAATYGNASAGTSRSTAYGARNQVTGSPSVTDSNTGGSNFLTSYGTYSNVNLSPTFSSTDTLSFNSWGGYFGNASVYPDDALVSGTSYGLEVVNTASQSTSLGSTANYGGKLTVSGVSDTNEGIDISVSGGTVANYGLYIASVTGTSPYAIYDVSGANSYLSGNLGIGTTTPAKTLSVQGDGLFSGDLSVANLTATGTVAFTSLGTGLVKSTSGTLSIAAAGTDYAGPTTGSSLLYGNGSGGFSNASISSPLTFSGGFLGIQVANTSQPGYLTSTDWNTFNNKVSTTRAINTTYPLQGGGDLSADRTLSLAFGTTTSNTWAGTQTFTNTPVLGTLSGLVGANNGALYQIATSTNFVTSIAAGTGINVSGSTGAVTILNAGLLSLAQTYGSAQTGAITFATSTVTANGQTHGVAITNSSGAFTFTPTISGTLNVAGGGTGAATFTGGILIGNGTNAFITRTLTGPAAGITVTNGTGVSGNPALALANDLAALEGLSSTGFSARTTTDTWAQRTMTGTTNRLTVTNGDGVSGNPTFDISSSYVGQSSITTLGTITTGTWNGTTVAVANGGTGATTLTGLLQGNGTSPITGVTGTAGQIPYYNGTNTLAATSTIFISTASNVGIGTASPSSKLHVIGSLGGAPTGNFTDVTMTLQSSATAGVGVGASLDFGGNTGNGVATYPFASLFGAKESAAAANYAGYLAFFTVDSAGTNAEKLRITSTGKVGVGLTTPNSLLSVSTPGAGGVGTRDSIISNQLGATTLGGIYSTLEVASPYGTGLAFDVYKSNVGQIEAMRIANSGNVGIGTTTPASPLDVVGNTGARGGAAEFSSGVGSGATLSNQLNITNTNGNGVGLSGFGLLIGFNGSGITPSIYHTVNGAHIVNVQNGPLTFGTNNTARLTITGAGNIGFGTTDVEAWSALAAIEGPTSSIGFGASTDIHILGNAYYDGTWKYKTTAPATDYYEYQGTHNWRVAGSGTIDTAITWNDAMTLDNSGRLGIGTTVLGAPLHVQGAGTTDTFTYQQITASTAAYNASPMAGIMFENKYNSSGAYLNMGGISVTKENTTDANTASYLSLYSRASGNVIFERLRLSSTGAMKLSGYGAGTLVTDASGNVTASSDERLKNINGAFDRGLDEIMGLDPILYHWNAKSGLDQMTQYAGFSAQNVQSVIPEAIDVDPRGYLSLQDRPILAASINAIKELAGRTDALSIATSTLGTQVLSLSSSFASLQASSSMPRALSATSITATSIQIAQGVSTGALTAQSVNVDGTVSAARYIVPQTASVFSFGSTTIHMTVPHEALASGNVDLYKLAGYATAGVDALAARTDLLAVKLDDLSSRVAALEAMGAATSTSATTDAEGAMGLALTTIQDALKGIGIVIHKGYLALDSLVTHQLILVKGADGTSSTGSEIIPQGATELNVINPLVHPSSKVFLTFTSSVQGSWYISKKKEGIFTIALGQPQPMDVEFDYFLIQTDENAQEAAVGDVPPGSTEAPPPVSVDGGPVVTLNGEAAAQIPQGASWTDPGAHAAAADGTDLTSGITVSGSVDANTAGLYTITYQVTDSAGKEGHASRLVTVLAPTTGPSNDTTVTDGSSGNGDNGGGTAAAGDTGGTVSAGPDASPTS